MGKTLRDPGSNPARRMAVSISQGYDMTPTSMRRQFVLRLRLLIKTTTVLIGVLGLNALATTFAWSQVRDTGESRPLPAKSSLPQFPASSPRVERILEKIAAPLQGHPFRPWHDTPAIHVRVRLNTGTIIAVTDQAPIISAATDRDQRLYQEDVERRYLLTLHTMLNELQAVRVIRITPSIEAAEIIVNVDLADNAKASGGEAFVDREMEARNYSCASRFNNDGTRGAGLFIMPWTVIRTFGHSPGRCATQINIQYPTRAFLQEWALRFIADGKKTDGAIVDRSDPSIWTLTKLRSSYVLPFTADLAPLAYMGADPLPLLQDQTLGERALLDVGEYAFRREFARTVSEDKRTGRHTGGFGPNDFWSLRVRCYTSEHPSILAARLARALAFVRGYGVTVEALPPGDWRQQEGASFFWQQVGERSLLDYSSALDQFVEDRLQLALLSIVGRSTIENPLLLRNLNLTTEYLRRKHLGRFLDEERAAISALSNWLCD
jgi:hypothetical protein